MVACQKDTEAKPEGVPMGKSKNSLNTKIMTLTHGLK